MKKVLFEIAKKISLLAVCLSITVCSLTGCAGASNDGEGIDGMSLKEILSAVYSDCGDIQFPSLSTSKIRPSDSDDFSFYFGTDNTDSVAEAIVSEPKMSTLAYSLGLIRLKDGADASAFASEIKNSIDPARWICVVATVVETSVNRNVVLVLLDTEPERAAAIVAAFEKL